MSRKILFTLALSLSLIGCSNNETQPIVRENTPEVTAPATEDASISVAIEGFKYAPADLTVKAGTTVTWTNKDSAPHTVTSSGSVKTLDSDDLAQGDTYSYTFSTPGIYEYYCAIHPNMKAVVTVE